MPEDPAANPTHSHRCQACECCLVDAGPALIVNVRPDIRWVLELVAAQFFIAGLSVEPSSFWGQATQDVSCWKLVREIDLPRIAPWFPIESEQLERPGREVLDGSIPHAVVVTVLQFHGSRHGERGKHEPVVRRRAEIIVILPRSVAESHELCVLQPHLGTSRVVGRRKTDFRRLSSQRFPHAFGQAAVLLLLLVVLVLALVLPELVVPLPRGVI
mmetsp:Transcript_19193/g.26041  ORF Transcript_19193/g.26041 Transcript_19193/m.26041 type:complete len:215 (-) Transcript_19193:225-869(-)